MRQEKDTQRGKQQQSRDETTVRGLIPRVEPQDVHRRFIHDNPYVDAVMMKLYHVERLLNRPNGIDSFLPSDVALIISSIINDDRSEEWPVGREIELARRAGAEYVVPCDFPLYEGDPLKRRVEDIRTYVRDFKRFSEAISDMDTNIIPLVKGVTPRERKICYRTFKNELGIENYVCYCGQHFGHGNYINELQNHVENIISESKPENLMLVGLQSPNYLSRFPPEITAAAGQRWLRELDIRNKPMPVVRQNYGVMRGEAETGLGGGQSLLSSFSGNEGGVEVGV